MYCKFGNSRDTSGRDIKENGLRTTNADYGTTNADAGVGIGLQMGDPEI